MYRVLSALACAVFLAACTDATSDLADPVEPLGNFKLGHSEVVAPKVEKLLVSREATPEEWITAVDTAIENRFRRFDGDAFYHFGISVEAYSLPPPVVPGKSALSMRLTVWQDSTATKLNPDTEVINVIRVFESRLSLSREDQIKALAEEAAQLVEQWLREQQVEEGWFGGVPAPLDTEPDAALVDNLADETVI